MFIDNAAYIEEESAKPSPPPPFPRGPPMPPGYRPHRFPGEPPAGPLLPTRALAANHSGREIPTIGNIDDLGEGLSVCSCDDCRGKRVHPPPGFQWVAYDLIDPKATRSLELPGGAHGNNHRYLLCSHRLFGFVFKSRKWGKWFCTRPSLSSSNTLLSRGSKCQVLFTCADTARGHQITRHAR